MTGLLSATSCGCLVETDHGMVRVGLMVQVQHVLHSSHELPAHLRDAPLLLLPRLEFVFLSIWRTVEGDALGKPHRHHLVGKQLDRPIRVSFGCVAARDGYQMCFLSADLRFCPGRGRSLSAPVPPSNRVRTRPTDALINALASRSVMPSSALRLTPVSPRLARPPCT